MVETKDEHSPDFVDAQTRSAVFDAGLMSLVCFALNGKGSGKQQRRSYLADEWQGKKEGVYARPMQADRSATSSPTNQLETASSSYLRSARHQPVQWHPWGEAAFARAQAEDKPILLDIGAVWCHWCHVMDRESYEDPEIARIINDHFVAVKVDRDERPDVDSRYQSAIAMISRQGGWPLTGFLLPDGRPFF